MAFKIDAEVDLIDMATESAVFSGKVQSDGMVLV